MIPDDRTVGNGRDQSPTTSVFETATSAFNSTLDRGRQAWRQALTGPNNWLSSRSSSAPSTAPSSPTPSGYTGSAAGTSSGYSSAGSYGSAPTTAGSSSADAGYGSTDYSGYSSGTSYATPASSGASYGGPAAAGAAAGTASAGSVGSGSPWASTGTATAPSDAGAGAAYSGARSSTATAAPMAPDSTSWRPRTSVTATRGKRKNSRRQAQLTLSRVEPWSVMKFSFVVSVVAFIVLFVAVAVLYMALSSLGVFDSLQHTVNNLTSAKNQAGTNVSSWFSASRILGYTGMLGALNIVLITAISTIGAVIYNLIAQTIGGIEVTLRETE
jgi:hypothetical protein